MQSGVNTFPNLFRRVHPVLVGIISQQLLKIPIIELSLHKPVGNLGTDHFYLLLAKAIHSVCCLGFCKIFFLTKISSSIALALVYWLRLLLFFFFSIFFNFIFLL